MQTPTCGSSDTNQLFRTVWDSAERDQLQIIQRSNSRQAAVLCCWRRPCRLLHRRQGACSISLCHHVCTSCGADCILALYHLSAMSRAEWVQLLKRYGEHIRVDVLVRRHSCAQVPRQHHHSTCSRRCTRPHFHAQDQLPTPFGLVRSGVAPDHPETKVGRPNVKVVHSASSSSSANRHCRATTRPICQLQNVEHQFTGVAQDPRTTFIGNVKVGRDVQLPELQSLYSGVSTALGL